MMQNIVLIPCWRRPDFLTVTLEHIRNAKRAQANRYVFLVDYGFCPDVLRVIASFPFTHEVRHAPQHAYHGNSFNVLEGYKYAAHLARRYRSRLVYLIEEDIWVGKDFFVFHEVVQAQFDSFCVSAVHNQNDVSQYPPDASSVYYHPAFQSLGLSWRVDRLDVITAHAQPDYYGNMTAYLKSIAPESRHADGNSEQDGLINRLVEMSPIKCLYPYLGRAYHAGFVGYNRHGRQVTGPLPRKVAALRSMPQDEMNARASARKDIRSIDLTMDYDVRQFVLR
jgi:hypothetical protein